MTTAFEIPSKTTLTLARHHLQTLTRSQN